ncbi:TrgA family protein [Pseudooceanicola nanhaiensis]|uniref:TrgA family protein n=1 Tax=Pseudooceanicola nanhaiensis TaxID=375761 RepID=UPI001CD3C52E|nr:TrgA family protein [Pseudooceanicola nanhaiensis]MCA0921511.1 TrgA family protein [Pseudooceanicola nanhaiensis]
MPTAARLIGAICLLILAFVVSGMVQEVMPDETNFGWMLPLNMVLGLLVGWTTLGKRADGSLSHGNAAVMGITAVAVLVFWAVALQAGNEALRLSLERRFDGPMEALLSLFPIAGDYGQHLLHMHILWTLAVGGMLAGIFTNMAGRRWR